MGVFGAFDDVLDEVFRLHHFADVVEVGPDANEESVGTDGFGGGFGHGGDGHGVVVGSRSATGEFHQQRM